MASKVVVDIVARNLTKRGFKDVEKQSQKVQAAVTQVGRRLKMVGAAAAFGTAIAVNKFAQFDRGVREIGTLLGGLTENQIKTMGDEIQAMAIKYGQGMDVMTKARYDIVSAGFTKAADSAELLAASSKLAIAGVTEVSKTADVLTTVLNAYGMSVKEAGRVSDVLFTTVRLGKTTMDQLASTFGVAAAVAPTLGISIEELGAAISALTSRGLRTDNVVTALNATITQMLKPSDALKRRILDLGFSSAKAMIAAKGLSGTLKLLTDGMTETELAALFPNVRAMRAVFPLAGEAAQKFKTDLKEMGGAAGAAEHAFSQLAESPAQKIAKLKARFESAMIAIGEAALPLLNIITKAVEGFSNLSKAGKILVVSLFGLVGVLKIISPIITAFGTSIVSLVGAAGPIGLFIAGGIALSGVLLSLSNNIIKSSENANRFKKNIGDMLQQQMKLQGAIEKTNKLMPFELRMAAGHMTKKDIEELMFSKTGLIEIGVKPKLMSAEDFKRQYNILLAEELKKASDAVDPFAEKLKSLQNINLAGIIDELHNRMQDLESDKLDLVVQLTIDKNNAQARKDLEAVLAEMSTVAATLKPLEIRLLNEENIAADKLLFELAAEDYLATEEALQESLNETETLGTITRLENARLEHDEKMQLLQAQADIYRQIYGDNLDFQIAMIDIQAKQFSKVVKDEVAIKKWAEAEKLKAAKNYLQQQSGLYKAFSAGYDTFIQSLVDKEMTGKERRERIWESMVNSFVSFLGEMLKQVILNAIASKLVSAGSQKAAVAMAKITGSAIAQAYSQAAVLASIASFGAAAAIGTTGVMAGMATVQASTAAGFQEGGIVGDDKNKLTIFKTQGTDTVPAMLTPGEAVIPRQVVNENPEAVSNLLQRQPEEQSAGTVQQITISPQFQISAIDAQSVDDFVSSYDFRQALIEAINDNLIRLRSGEDAIEGDI